MSPPQTGGPKIPETTRAHGLRAGSADGSPDAGVKATSKITPADPPVLVLGLGNLLVGDEGAGIYAARALAAETWPAHVRVVDGGAGGLHLVELLRTHSRLVLIDAARDGAIPGTVTAFRARAPGDLPPALGTHDLGLRDLIAAVASEGTLPPIDVITISVSHLKTTKLELSPPVAAALPEVVRRVRALIG